MKSENGGVNSPRARFQQLLHELFEFDCADLDFGIYRIMNHKRAAIERFITEDLPRAIAEELDRGALAAQSQAAQELQGARQKVLDALGDDVLDVDGNLAEPYRNTKAGREYLAAQERARSARGREALEADVYNHLFTFFSRYWQDGDFISKRRYSRKERYAIPYNGEEVYLYWANHDQYYIKTGEYFTDYSWKAPNGVGVHFKLKAADVEQNNVKGEKRFFVPGLHEIAWDARAHTLTIPFEFRPLAEQEKIAYGQRNQQEAIVTRALEEIPRHLPKGAPQAHAALAAEKQRADGTATTLLEHHLRQYTRRNTSDFFIHKDLKGLLSRELDFYLKNEVLNLEELEAAGEDLAEGWFQLLRLVKGIGLRIIEFLAQIEEFQKMLWEKKKLVTETFYVITVGNIPETFYAEIAANVAQWDEWAQMLRLDALPRDLLSGDWETAEGRLAFLKAHPSLPLDTRRFPPDFVDRLLASYDNLDEMTDGLLVHSENWQALNLLQEKYRERVKCVYIDPPYNTGSDDFIYRDNYQHSSWLAMMYDRLTMAREWMSDDEGSIHISIDDNEHKSLQHAAGSVFGSDNFVATVIWQKIFSPKNTAKYFSEDHDYILVFARDKMKWAPHLLPRTGEAQARYTNPDNDPRGPWTSSDLTARNYYSQGIYDVISPSGRSFRPAIGTYWRVSKGKFERLDREGRVWWGPDGANMPRLKRFYSEVKPGVVPQTLWRHVDVGNTQEAKKELLATVRFARTEDVLNTVKPTRLLLRVLKITTSPKSSDMVLDFFAGSGTTGHAVINLNREDGGQRKFILLEMAEYFDTVLLPRIKNVTFSPEWKDGQPKRAATQQKFERGPRIVKVIRLESYEDALNNLAFDEGNGQMAMQFEDYLLKYMLRWETRHSETLLNVEKLAKPFDYCLHIHRDGETRVQRVDLPETFNYLIGLDVETRRALDDSGRHYLVYRGVTREGQRAAVIWRETEGWQEEDYRRDRDFVAAQKVAEGADLIYANGDSLIPGARALEGVFKARMFAAVEG